MTTKKQISYINKDFSEFRKNLIDYSKTYFPNSYNDFTPSSPGMMFIEMASYVGDVLAFQNDNNIQESYLSFARQHKNLYELAYMFGYKPNVTGVSSVNVDFYQQVPAMLVSGSYFPDMSYALYIESNAKVNSTLNTNVKFLVEDPIDFSVSSSYDPTEVTINSVSASIPTYFLLKKTRKAISATINTSTFNFGSPEKYQTVTINDSNIIKILDVTDSDLNEWEEVDYLANEMVYRSVKNINPNDPNTYTDASVPYLLKLEKVQRRFITRFIDSGSLQIQFGAGGTLDNDEEIIPNKYNIGLGLPFEKTKLNAAYSPNNFLYTKTYGISPSNTTLTFRYLTGGGVVSNVPSNDLNTMDGTVRFINSNIDPGLAQTIFSTLVLTNPEAADGGKDGDTIEEIRNNASSNIQSQMRVVTPNDYLIRTLNLPSKYGSVSKVFVQPNSNNIIDLYVLSYNNNKNLSISSPALKQNISTYLYQYNMSNDNIDIKDAFIINIGVNFEVIILPEYNNNEVLVKCINALKDHFNIDNWMINQPINLREIYIKLDKIPGVETVKLVEITNKVGGNYSSYSYDIKAATRNNIIFPSLDPMIFEVLDGNTDITGKISAF